MHKRGIIVAVAIAVALGVAAVATAVSANAAQGAFVEIVNSISGKCADVENESRNPGALVHQWSCHNDPNQLWLAEDQGEGYVRFVNNNSGHCLTASIVNRLVFQDLCANGGPTQRWRWLVADESGHLVLQNGLGDCLALNGVFSARDGWPIVTHECATTGGQFWHAG
jgi:hypothetical protein